MIGRKPLFLGSSLVLVFSVSALAATKVKPTRTVDLKSLAGFNLSAPSPHDADTDFRVGPETNMSFQKFISGAVNRSRVPSKNVPAPPGVNPILPGAFGFNGIRHAEQRLGVDGGNQFSLEPPDQGLAVGDCVASDCGSTTTYVVDAVNNAIAVRDTSGNVLDAASMDQFYFGVSEVIRADPDGTPGKYGPSLSDPKVYYDPSVHRWFVSEVEFDTDDKFGFTTGTTSFVVAVSQSSDPAGAYTIYQVNTTNDGTGPAPNPIHDGCPCFGDQPLIGVDANAFWVSTNEFGSGFNGAQIYAMDKAAMVAGSAANVQLISGGALEEGISYSVQPATIPPGGSFVGSDGGTQFFLSSLEFFGGLDNRIAIWAATNTSSITSTPAIVLKHSIVTTEIYGMPPVAQQPTVTPAQFCYANPWGQPILGQPYDLWMPTGCELNVGGILASQPFNVHEPLVKTNDDRMQQVVLAHGRLWAAVTTPVKTKNGPTRTAAAYFIFNPFVDGSGNPSATIRKQGYIAVNNTSVMFPAFGANSSGKGVLGFSLTGPGLYPSAAWTKIDDNPSNAPGPVSIAGSDVDPFSTGFGLLPDDGFTGYPVYDDRAGRWGDYGGAATDSSGNIWVANEFIPILSRSVLGNWGTFISKVTP